MTLPSRKFWQKTAAFVPGVIRNDILRKFMALLLTTLIFLYFYIKESSGVKIRDINGVPMKVVIPQEYDFLELPRPVVDVRLKCDFAAPENITANDIKIELKVEPRPGQTSYTLPLPLSAVSAPRGTKVELITPKEITVSIDKRETRKIKVEPNLEQAKNLPEGYLVVKASATPQEVTVSGPASLISGNQKIRTVPVPFDESITGSFTYPAKLVIPPGIQITPGQVRAEIVIEKSFLTKTFKNVPVKLLSGQKIETQIDVEIVSSKTVDVTVSGLERIIGSMTEKDLTPYADISAFAKAGLHNKIPVKCWSEKDGIVIKSIVPDTINARVGRSQSK